MNKYNCDYLIIGAGIIGLTLARELNKQYPKAKILILEKEKSIGMHASGRNSGVLHTGIYYPANTLKAKFCKEGADLLFAYAQENNIPVRKDGKIIVATSETEAKRLDALLANAQASDIQAEKIYGADIRQIEPYACSDFGGIYCKDTAVIDSPGVLAQLTKELAQNHVEILFNQKINKIDDANQEVFCTNNVCHYGLLINAAGSFADSVAKLVNVGLEYTLIPFKGTYYKLDPAIAHIVKASIYPVPNPDLPFLGVHLTRVMSGDVYIGPTVIPAFGRENYHFGKGVNAPEVLRLFGQFIKLYGKNTQNFRNLVKVAALHSTKLGVIKSARNLMNQFDNSWVKPSPKVGIRPQLLNTKEMKLEMDFLIKNGKNSIHILNSISPACTSSFAVARYIVNEITNNVIPSAERDLPKSNTIPKSGDPSLRSG